MLKNRANSGHIYLFRHLKDNGGKEEHEMNITVAVIAVAAVVIAAIVAGVII